MATARARRRARRAGTKRKEQKNVPHGVAPSRRVQNHLVAITDPMGNTVGSSAGSIGFRLPQGHPVRGPVAAQNAAHWPRSTGSARST